MVRRAARVDANHAEIVGALRAYGCSVQSLAGVADGCPDLLIGIHGRTGLLEVKDGAVAPSKRRLTPDQVRWSAEWRGGPLATVCSVEDALRFARMLAFESC
jgi:hypothetical protein